MFSIVAAVAMTVIGQSPIYQQPIYIKPTRKLYHDIHFHDVVRTRIDIKGVMPDGSSFPVPIINGYRPEITIKRNSTSIRRVFTYKDRIKWAGNSVLVYAKVTLLTTKPKSKPKPKPLKLTGPITKPRPKADPIIVTETKRSPSSIESKEADFTKKFPRY